MSETAGFKVTLEDYTPPAAPPSAYTPLVKTLMEAGPDKAAKIEGIPVDQEKSVLRAIQEAAKVLDRGARKRRVEVSEDGKTLTMWVSVGERVTRNAPAAPSAATAETAAA